MKLEFSRQIRKNPQISNFINILSVGAEMFHADGRTDRHTKLMVACRNFANAPKHYTSSPRSVFKWFLPISEQTVTISLYSIDRFL
jgi:hypothetical protein